MKGTMYLNIEITADKVIRLGELPSGDVEVTVSTRRGVGELSDYVVAQIPSNRRQIIADFLVGKQIE